MDRTTKTGGPLLKHSARRIPNNNRVNSTHELTLSNSQVQKYNTSSLYGSSVMFVYYLCINSPRQESPYCQPKVPDKPSVLENSDRTSAVAIVASRRASVRLETQSGGP